MRHSTTQFDITTDHRFGCKTLAAGARLKQMTPTAILFAVLAGSAMGQAGIRRENSAYRPSSPSPAQRANPVPHPQPAYQPEPARRPQPSYSPEPARTHVQPTRTANPIEPERVVNVLSRPNAPLFHPGNVSARTRTVAPKHSSGIPVYSRPVFLRGTVAYQNPNRQGAWRSDNVGDFHCRFGFGLYVFSPTAVPCFVSPWYYYGALPAYISQTIVNVQSNPSCDWNQGSVYAGGDSALDQSVGNIQSMFLNQDANALNALIPSSGETGVYTDGNYDYSLNADQFQLMLGDSTQNVETVNFEVTQVLQNNDQAVVRATHTVTDPDGGQDVVYQLYHLQNEGGQYVITDFMTSHDVL